MPVRKAGRPVAKRMANAKRLLFLQGGAFGVQILAAIAGGSAVFWNLV
jgi:hypothetical protein